MSRVIATLLDKPEEQIAAAINKLEQKVGYTSEDVQLLADNARRVRAKIAELGLDPDDTTGEELYHALQARFERDSNIVDRALGIKAGASLPEKIAKAVAFLDHIGGSPQVWAIKKPKLKALLLDAGLPKSLRLLNYRSIDSAVKREDIFELAFGACLAESHSWQKSFKTKLSKLTSADYDLRKVGVVCLDVAKWGNLEVSYVGQSSRELGVVGIVGSNLSSRTTVLSVALAIHDQVSKLSTKKTTRKLANLNPTLSWWEDTEHLLAWNDGQPISFNYKDVAHAHINQLAYETRVKEKATEAFWKKLTAQYKQKIEAIPGQVASIEQEVEQKTGRMFNPAEEFAVEMESVENNG